MDADHGAYPPLDTLKPVADDVWIVNGPALRFGLPWPKMPFPTRMTIIRLGGRDLFVHSPTPLPPILRRAVEALGTPRWIVGPNRIHYWWIPDWHAAYPDAHIYLAPHILAQAHGRITGPSQPLEAAMGYPWDGALDTLPIAGRYMTEVEFFHRASRTLILTDLIENFEASHLRSPLLRLLARLGGVLAPHGGTPRDLRLTFPRAELRAAVETMIGWAPERIILAHGRWHPQNGTAELRRAFAWLQD